MKIKKVSTTLSIIALISAFPAHSSWRNHQPMVSATIINSATETLSSNEIESLIFMREEEKLARDTYLTFYEQWKHPVFSNIARSEQRHTDAVKRLIDKYALVDPVTDDSIGIFNNESLSNLFATLSVQGENSLVDAMLAGALIEETDILDLQQAIASTDHTDFIEVYENLMRGSRNHLRAFVRQLENLGTPYEAQLMNQLEVDMILDEPLERGRAKRGRNR